MTLPAVIQEKLVAELDPAAVSVLEHNGAPYLEGWYVISAANGIFGFDGWSHEVLCVEHMGNGLYSARVRVTALGVTRVDVGTGAARGDTAEAHETAIKGAATDGLKRALRTFGAQFGNDLYGTTATRRAAPAAPSRRPQERATGDEPTRPAGFANVGALMSWALATHKMTRGNVLDTLGAKNPEDIDLDTAAERIEAALVPAGAR